VIRNLIDRDTIHINTYKDNLGVTRSLRRISRVKSRFEMKIALEIYAYQKKTRSRKTIALPVLKVGPSSHAIDTQLILCVEGR